LLLERELFIFFVYVIGNKNFTARTKTRIATKKPMTCIGVIMNLELYSSSYLIKPPNVPGMWILLSLAIVILEMLGI
jgi:hypothetical protein